MRREAKGEKRKDEITLALKNSLAKLPLLPPLHRHCGRGCHAYTGHIITRLITSTPNTEFIFHAIHPPHTPPSPQSTRPPPYIRSNSEDTARLYLLHVFM